MNTISNIVLYRCLESSEKPSLSQATIVTLLYTKVAAFAPSIYLNVIVKYTSWSKKNEKIKKLAFTEAFK